MIKINNIELGNVYVIKQKHKCEGKHFLNLIGYNNKKENLDENSPWTKCKLLGSLLDTEEDIQLQKKLTINHMKDKQHIQKSKNRDIHQKIQYFKMFPGSICLYHSELWTLTKNAT